jgi:serine/threonine protein kinase
MNNLKLLIMIFPLLTLLPATLGFPSYLYLSPSQLLSRPLLVRKVLLDNDKESLALTSGSFAPPAHKGRVKPIPPPWIAPAPSPTSKGSVENPRDDFWRRHHRRHHRSGSRAVSPSPLTVSGCGQTCLEPLTSTPIGSPCGCVFPMKIRLLFDVSLYSIFPVVNELEIEVAAGTYLKQSQVIIMGASADTQNQDKTAVDINLVPLGEKFDNTTAILTYNRFWQKQVPINKTLFGNYDVAFITYPGLPSSPPSGIQSALGPSGSIGEFPITAQPVNKSQKTSNRTVFVIAFSALVVVVVCIAAVAIIVKCRKVTKPSNAVGPVFTSSIKRSGIGIGSMFDSSINSTSASFISAAPPSILSVKTFSILELEKATDKFSSKRVLGEGGFGRVYHGVTEEGTEIAVKLLTRDIQNGNGDREFIAEIEMLSRLHHRNLVKLIGICIEGHTRCLIYEVVPNGSVESHLHGVDKSKSPLDWDARLKIALGAARGLAYLHEDSNPRVIHRDFKASNVLLENDFTPKVSDFGLAREATEGSHHISTRVMGTFGYVAPEYAMTGHLLVKSDVYSYGVVLLELLSGRKPVDMSQPSGQENLVTWARPLLTSREGLQDLVDPSLSGTYDFDDMAKVAAIASMCVHTEVTHRPFMGEVVQALKLIYNDSDETVGDYCSQRESSAVASDFKGEFVPSESSWWNGGGLTPRLRNALTMDYNSENESLPIKHGNRSGPLRTVRSKTAFYRVFKGSMSEHGGLLSRPPHWSGDDVFGASF